MSDKSRIHPWSITGQVPDKRHNFATRPGNGDAYIRWDLIVYNQSTN